MADRLEIQGSPSIDLSGASRVASREGYCVFIKGFNVYKVLTSEQQASDALMRITQAKAADVPVVRSTKKYKATLYEGTAAAKQVWVLEMEKHFGEFFQLSKSGHVARLANFVKGAAEANNAVLQRAMRSLKAAQEHKISDTQGIFDAASSTAIRFFDIHTASTADGNIDAVLKLLE